MTSAHLIFDKNKFYFYMNALLASMRSSNLIYICYEISISMCNSKALN